MADYTRQLKKHLKEAGCRFERQGRGDHERHCIFKTILDSKKRAGYGGTHATGEMTGMGLSDR